jgi:hypothetical protein
VPAPQPGPASPDAPGPISWYALLQRGDCAGLAEKVEDSLPPEHAVIVPVYRSLVQICRWLDDPNSDVDWDAASEALDVTAAVDFCLHVAPRTMLAGFVAAHETSPDAQVTLGEPAEGTACPVEVTEVLIGSVRADIRGRYLYEVEEVLIDGQPTEQDPPDDDNPEDVQLKVFVPCLTPGSQVDVVVRGSGYTRTVSGVPVPIDLEQDECEPTDSPSAT